MNHWLGVAGRGEVVQGSTGVVVSVSDLADRPPERYETERSSTVAASGFAGSIPRTCPTAGTPG